MTIHLIPLPSIKIPPNRQRRDFNPAALNELANSIERLGLFHPIVLRQEGEEFFLVAGERRLRAIQDLHELGRRFSCGGKEVGKDLIPYTPMGELSSLEAMEAELEENTVRTDLTWQERALATARLASFRTSQAASANLPPPSTAALAEEIRGSGEGYHQNHVRKEIILAEHLSDPTIQGAKTADEAFKILKQKERRAKSAAFAERVGMAYTSSAHTLLQGDSLSWMASAPADQFDVLLTDPPYGIGADTFGNSNRAGTIQAHSYSDSPEAVLPLFESLAVESFRLTHSDAHAYVFCDIDQFPLLKALFEGAGWRVFRTPLIWFKPSAFRAPWPEQGPQRKYETILYAVKGEKKSLRLAGDVITCPSDENLGHPAQKPVPLLVELLSRSCRAGEKALDPFCGTGSIFPAAQELKLFATGIELDPGHYGIAAKRLEGLK